MPVYPPTTLVEIENTHNRSGGIVFPQDEVVRICALARERGIATFLDGARLWNASSRPAGPKRSSRQPFDLVAVSFSKGLGAPGGSLLAGSRKLIARSDAARRMLGGAMRQTGFSPRPASSPSSTTARASPKTTRTRAASPRRSPRARWFEIDLATVQTNIVVFRLRPDAVDAATLVRARASAACSSTRSTRARSAR